MVHLLMLFPREAASDDLDAYLSERLVPVLRRFDGVTAIVLSRGDVMSPQGPPRYARVATVTCAALSDVIAFGSSPETKAVRDEGERFGVEILMYEAGEA